ncbi:hypothetical protein ACF08M_22020 [Streptomyces sp. NPDC015032]|uniref:hypothetical protein n=1 Tax=Streptomyces sp. NPDC015032 TaxID=3364937 RepID=UPI003703313A
MGGEGFVGTRGSRGLLAAGAAALLLAACGGGGGSGDEAKGVALDSKQLTSVLPDAKAVPGWRMNMKPGVLEPNPELPPAACVTSMTKKQATACGNATFWGSSSFARKADATTLDFWALAYKNEKAADAAYDALAGWYGGDRVGVNAEKMDLGSPGDDREANRTEIGALGGPGTLTYIRVGTTVLGFSTGTTGRAVVPDQEVKAIAAMFVGRAQQAQDGEKPSAALPGD